MQISMHPTSISRRAGQLVLTGLLAGLLATLGVCPLAIAQPAGDAEAPAPAVGAMSVLAFAPTGELLIGDSKTASVARRS